MKIEILGKCFCVYLIDDQVVLLHMPGQLSGRDIEVKRWPDPIYIFKKNKNPQHI